MEALFPNCPQMLEVVRTALHTRTAVWLHPQETSLLLQNQLDMSNDLGFTIHYRLTAGILEIFPHSEEFFRAWKDVLEHELHHEDDFLGPTQRAAETLREMQTADVPVLPPPARRSPRLAAKSLRRPTNVN